MKKSLITLAALSTVLFTTVATAQTQTSESTTITDLEISASGNIVARAADVDGVTTCSSTNRVATTNRFAMLASNTNEFQLQTAFALLLTAQTTGRSVELISSGGCLSGSTSLITGVRLVD